MSQSADHTVKVTSDQHEYLANRNKSSMSAALDDVIYGDAPTQSFITAAVSNKESMTGIPTTAIPDVDEPTLSMWTTMNKRLITADHYMREEAAQDDVFMILSNIRSACTIGLWKLIAKDLEASEETIKKMYTWIDDTDLIKAFTGGGINSEDKGALYNWQVHGKCALFVWHGGKAGGRKISKFVNVPVDGLRRFTNPRDPTKYYYYQKFRKESDWTDPSKWEDVDSLSDADDVPSETQCVWYIEGGEKNRELVDKDTKKLVYPNIQPKDWVNNLENLYVITNPTPALNDNIVTTIMNKRYLVLMSIVAVQLGIVPIYKLQFGTDDPKLFPPSVDERLKDVNPTEYARQSAIVATWKSNMGTMVNTVDTAIRNGKPIAYQYGVTVERDEPRMAITGSFIQTMLGEYNQIIARATGLPISLIMSLGVELSTSRLTKGIVDVSLLATQLGFHDAIASLLKLEFAAEMEAEGIDVALMQLDKTDAKTSSEIQSLLAQAVLTLQRAGATPETLENLILRNEELPLQKVDMHGTTELSNDEEDESPVVETVK